MFTIELAILTVFGATWRRWLGGLPIDGKTFSRGFKFAILTGVLMPWLHATGFSWLHSVLMTVSIALLFSVGHGAWQDMGTGLLTRRGYLDFALERVSPFERNSRWYDYSALMIHHAIFMSFVALVSKHPEYALLIPLPATGYLLASLLHEKLPLKAPVLDVWTAYGELIFGAVVIGGLVLFTV